jgi:hypothetical protein
VSNALHMVVKDKHFKASFYREHFPGYKLFTIFRPYEDRIRSTFGYTIPENQKGRYATFDDLVKGVIKVGADNIGLMIKPDEYFLDCEVDYVLRFETLENDLNEMLRVLGYRPVRLKPCNSFKQ